MRGGPHRLRCGCRDRCLRGEARARAESGLRRLRGGEAPCVGHVVGRDRNVVARAWPQRSARHQHDRAGVAQAPATVLLLRRIRIAIARRVEGAELNRLAVFGQGIVGEPGLHQPSHLQCDRKPDRAFVTTAARERVGHLEPDPFQRYVGSLGRKFDGAPIRLHVLRRRRQPQRGHPASVFRGFAVADVRQGRDRASAADETVPRASDRSAARHRTCCIPMRFEDSAPHRRLRQSIRLCRASLRMRQRGSAGRRGCCRRNSASGSAHER